MIIIGTRGSALALAQTEWVRERILRRFPGLRISVKIIRTSADRDKTTSLRSVPSAGVFVKELERSLLDEDIDLAVHSMKDVPTIIAEGCLIAAIPEREDARDALIAAAGYALDTLPSGARIGTGSYRRQAQLLSLRPDLEIVDIRGNIDTRVHKTESGECDAVLLACAGLRRLGLHHRITTPFSFKQMLPAPGQGALAVEIRADDDRTRSIAAVLDHPPTSAAVCAERSFLEHLGGGCNVPIAVLAQPNRDVLAIEGLVASPDGRKTVRECISAHRNQWRAAAESLSGRILDRGGREILNEFRR